MYRVRVSDSPTGYCDILRVVSNQNRSELIQKISAHKSTYDPKLPYYSLIHQIIKFFVK